MKKKIMCLVLALGVMMPSTSAFAENIYDNDNFSFVEILSISDDNGLETLSIDTAVEKALKNSTELKTVNLSLAVSEEQLENSTESVDYNTGANSIQNILNLIKNQTSLKNSEEEKKVKEQKIGLEMEQLFIEILNLQREIALTTDTLDLEEKNLKITKAKLEMGLVSEQEYNESSLFLVKSKESLESKKQNLNDLFKNLNILIGEDDTSKRYNLDIDVTYDTLELETTPEVYATARVSESVSINNAKRNLEVSKKSYLVEQASDNATNISIMQSENSVSTAEMNIEDMIENMETQVINLYNTIKTSETSIENNKTELSNLKKNLEITKAQYEMGKVSEMELKRAYNNVASMENTIIKQIYEHNQNMKKFENIDLM